MAIAVISPLTYAQRGMTPAETLRVAEVKDAQISPDGNWVVYTVTTNEGDAARTALWVGRVAGGSLATRPLLPAGWEATSPRWSSDSQRIAFLAEHDNRYGIWMVGPMGGTPRFVTQVRETNFFITYAGERLAWSPDSHRIAYINATAETPLGNVARRGEDDPRVIDRIQYKSRTSFSDNLRTHVWIVDVDSPVTFDGAQPHELTSGSYYDHALTWNPQGSEIAFLSNHEQDPDAINNSDIFAVDMQGRVRQITSTSGCEYEPQWSPDGKWIAYTATTRDVTTIDSVAEDRHVWVIDAGGGRGRELTAALDRRAQMPRWSPDSQTIFFLANSRGQSLLYRVGVDGSGEMRPLFARADARFPADSTWLRFLTLPFQISSYSISLSHRPITFSFTISDPLHPAEVWVSPLALSLITGNYTLFRVSAHNDAFLRAVRPVEPEEFSFKSFDNTPIQAWLIKPAGFRSNQRYPLILSIHGGPHGMYGYTFYSDFQAYAARGYAVLYMNPRGSNGYGQKFSDGTLREWGGGDYRDLMAGVDEALRTRNWIDADYMGVVGGSYGGFMTNWIITQTPRFRAAVSRASVSNLISFYSTSLYQDLIHAEFGGFPWDDYETLWQWSPLRYARQAQTPTLFIHGEQDNDVHITQSEEMYMALRRRGIETVLARYPREGHSFHEPKHRQDALERTLAWFDRFLK
ncbi:MAG TPA: S9 family peptidase [Pyrinomonadaceae bacterium]|nr:S9 family peptidase [Pyrinomonadaceae bacterium]